MPRLFSLHLFAVLAFSFFFLFGSAHPHRDRGQGSVRLKQITNGTSPFYNTLILVSLFCIVFSFILLFQKLYYFLLFCHQNYFIHTFLIL